MDSLLSLLLANDNQIRKQAENQFNQWKYSSTNQCLVEMVQYAGNPNKYQSISIICCILLRNITIREPRLWECLQENECQNMLRYLIQAMLEQNQNPYIQRKICEVICPLARISPIPEFYNQILNLISLSSSSSSPSFSSSSNNIKLGLYVIDKLYEYRVVSFITDPYPVISAIEVYIHSSDPDMLRLAVQALLSIMFETSLSVDITDVIFSKISRVITTILQSNEDESNDFLSNIERFVEEKPYAFNQSASMMFDVILAITSSTLFSESIRSTAIELVTTFAVNKLFKIYKDPTKWIPLLHQCLSLIHPHRDINNLIDVDVNIDIEEDSIDKDVEDYILSNSARTSLEILSQNVDTKILHHECFSLCNMLLSSGQNQSIQKSFIILSLITEGIKQELYTYLSQLVQSIVKCFQSNDVNVIYEALDCIETLIEEYNGDSKEEEEDENKEEEEEEEEGRNNENNSDKSHMESQNRTAKTLKPIQKLFPDLIPSSISTLLANLELVTSSIASIHITRKALECLRIFFNPDRCDKKACKPYAASLLDYCIPKLSDKRYSVKIRQEIVSIIANVSVLSPKKVIQSRYKSIISHIKLILNTNTLDLYQINSSISSSLTLTSFINISNKRNRHAVIVRECSLLKGKCLECFAIVGKAVGYKIFYHDGIEMMNLLVPMLTENVDYSDPLSSYIIQTCVRIASVLEDSFQPFISKVIPPLLTYISQPLTMEVIEEENPFLSSSSSLDHHDENDDNNSNSGNNSNSTNTEDSKDHRNSHKIYQRGIGQMNVKFSTYEIIEKETALRVLYQYCLDIPSYLTPYIPHIIISVVHILNAPTASDELYMITCAIFSEAYGVFLKGLSMLSMSSDRSQGISTTTSTRLDYQEGLMTANQMFIVMISNLIVAWERCQLMGTHRHTPIEAVYILIDGIREILKVTFDQACHYSLDGKIIQIMDVNISNEKVYDILRLIRDEISIWIKRRFVDNIVQSREDDCKIEEDTITGLQDMCSWLIKIKREHITQIPFFVADFIPFLQGILSSGISSDILQQIPLLWLLDTIEYIHSLSLSLSQYILPYLLNQYDGYETIVVCVYGFGVIGRYGGETILQNEQILHILQVLSQVLEWNHIITLKDICYHIELDDDTMILLKENAISSLFKLCLYQTNMIQNLDINLNDMLSAILTEMPITNDLFEAKAFHSLFLFLATSYHPILYGIEYHRLPDIINVLVKLSVCVEITKDTDINSQDFWNDQIISKECFYGSQTFIKAMVFGQTSIPGNYLMKAQTSLSPSVIQLITMISKQ